MKIDNYQKAIALVEKMKAHLPIPAYMTSELVRLLQEKEEEAVFEAEMEVKIGKLVYSGDDGGILCSLEFDCDSKLLPIVSLTHLRIDSEHPLFEEIRAYQNRRVVRLGIANGAPGRARRAAKRNRPSKGFGA